jgi:hypothetical protein
MCVCWASFGLDNKMYKTYGAYIKVCHSDEFSTFRAFDMAPRVKGAENTVDRTVNLSSKSQYHWNEPKNPQYQIFVNIFNMLSSFCSYSVLRFYRNVAIFSCLVILLQSAKRRATLLSAYSCKQLQ